jgi:hypothetical protein
MGRLLRTKKRVGYAKVFPGSGESKRRKKTSRLGGFFLLLAERVRFELTVRLNVRQISSLVHSATLPPFLILSVLLLACCCEVRIIANLKQNGRDFFAGPENPASSVFGNQAAGVSRSTPPM